MAERVDRALQEFGAFALAVMKADGDGVADRGDAGGIVTC